MSRHKEKPPDGRKKRSIRIWFGIFFALGVGATLFGRSLAGLLREKNGGRAAVPSAPAGRTDQPTAGPKGPWGTLEYKSMPLENYEELYPNGAELIGPPRWVFENYSQKQLAELLGACDLTDEQRAFLLDTNHWEVLTNGFAISPGDELAFGLKKAARQCLYPILARSAENSVQSSPFHFPLDGFDERFANSRFPSEKIEMIRGLTYTNNGVLCLCVEEQLQKLLTADEFMRLMETLYFAPTWRVGLRVTSDSDVNALARYWGRGGREKMLRPLLESLARNGGSINISYFLPPFARLRLYTYPDSDKEPAAAKEDCFYTALNFFNERPDPRLADGENASKELKANYYRIQDQLRFGDLIALVDSNRKPVHICVYIADDIVFTKDGMGFARPWVLMKFRDMLTDYAFEKTLTVVHFRRKDMI
jgi:hypothetical protein